MCYVHVWGSRTISDVISQEMSFLCDVLPGTWGTHIRLSCLASECHRSELRSLCLYSKRVTHFLLVFLGPEDSSSLWINSWDGAVCMARKKGWAPSVHTAWLGAYLPSAFCAVTCCSSCSLSGRFLGSWCHSCCYSSEFHPYVGTREFCFIFMMKNLSFSWGCQDCWRIFRTMYKTFCS